MAKRVQVKKGDVFEVFLDDGLKGYFQFISLDSTQLNSEVVRVFKQKHKVDEEPILDEIVKGSVYFYVHIMIKLGVKKNFWNKIGNVKLEDDLTLPYFRSSRDYGNPEVKVSKNWYVWQVNEEMVAVGELNDNQKKFDVGVVYALSEIPTILNTGKTKFFYPSY